MSYNLSLGVYPVNVHLKFPPRLQCIREKVWLACSSVRAIFKGRDWSRKFASRDDHGYLHWFMVWPRRSHLNHKRSPSEQVNPRRSLLGRNAELFGLLKKWSFGNGLLCPGLKRFYGVGYGQQPVHLFSAGSIAYAFRCENLGNRLKCVLLDHIFSTPSPRLILCRNRSLPIVLCYTYCT